MNNKAIYLLFLLGFIGFRGVGQENNKDLSVELVPWPKEIQIKPVTITTGSQLLFVNPSGNKEIERVWSGNNGGEKDLLERTGAAYW